jgi:antirestriction protein ArdC
VTDTTSAAQSTRSGVPTAFADGATLASDISDLEERSIAFADADGWRCFYPESRGHLTAAEARAARGLPPETPQEREAAEFVLVAESAWFGDDAD